MGIRGIGDHKTLHLSSETIGKPYVQGSKVTHKGQAMKLETEMLGLQEKNCKCMWLVPRPNFLVSRKQFVYLTHSLKLTHPKP